MPRDFVGRQVKPGRGLSLPVACRHDASMRMPWNKSKNTSQLDLLDEAMDQPHPQCESEDDDTAAEAVRAVVMAIELDSGASTSSGTSGGRPLVVPVTCLHEDPNNPRTEFPEAELEELAEDVRQHGILQPIVVHPVDAFERHQIHFGAKRWRAALLAELHEVPVFVRDAPADPYTQVAENQRRHGLTPLDLARFIQKKVVEGDSNATVAKRLGMNLTTVAHHLTLLNLPPELDEALKSGRCTSPRTLHELSQLDAEHPEQVRTLVAGDADITRAAVLAIRAERMDAGADVPGTSQPSKRLAPANAALNRLEQALERIKVSAMHGAAQPALIALRARIAHLASRWQ